MIRNDLLIAMSTDSKTVLRKLFKSGNTAERGLMIDMKPTREAFGRKLKRSVRCGCFKYKITDRLIRLSKCEALRERMTDRWQDDLPIENWPKRAHTTDCDGKRSSSEKASQKEKNPIMDDN